MLTSIAPLEQPNAWLLEYGMQRFCIDALLEYLAVERPGLAVLLFFSRFAVSPARVASQVSTGLNVACMGNQLVLRLAFAPWRKPTPGRRPARPRRADVMPTVQSLFSRLANATLPSLAP